MTVGSDTYMPKSKAPKMDDLDYSKRLQIMFWYLVLFDVLATRANALACVISTSHLSYVLRALIGAEFALSSYPPMGVSEPGLLANCIERGRGLMNTGGKLF